MTQDYTALYSTLLPGTAQIHQLDARLMLETPKPKTDEDTTCLHKGLGKPERLPKGCTSGINLGRWQFTSRLLRMPVAQANLCEGQSFFSVHQSHEGGIRGRGAFRCGLVWFGFFPREEYFHYDFSFCFGVADRRDLRDHLLQPWLFMD